MRIKLKLYSNNNIILPKSYNHIMQGFIYSNLDEDFKKFMHQEGFNYNNRKYKLFTFSKIRGEKEPNIIDGKVMLDRFINFSVSSINADFIENFSQNIFKNQLIIGKNYLKFHSMELYDDDFLKKYYDKDKIKIKMISPVVVYSTDENKKTTYYSPYDNEFKERVTNNLINKYKAYYDNDITNNDFSIELCEGREYKSSAEIYKGFYIKGYYGIFNISGNFELMKVAFYSGIGGKNSQGFGCFNIMK